MKLSVSAWSLQEKLFGQEITICDFIHYCHRNGIRSVELLDCFIKGESDIREITELLARLDMEVSAYSIGNDFVLPDSGERNKQVEYLKKSMDLTRKLGSSRMRVFGGSEKEGIASEYAEDWIVECFQKAAPFAEEKGITMVLENHGLITGKSEQIKRVIERVGSKALKANADVANFILANENSLDAVKALYDQIGYVHLKDLKRVNGEEGYTALDGSVYQGVVLGCGDVPIAQTILYLKEKGYSGYLSIEYEGLGDPMKDTSECIEYLKNAVR
ncbi:sugar phosphate isomerase/epimerase family protein [Anaerocolumna xylanovorans]|uniref:Sugar phosphate isomerase/epimerase n=1 Tax=Anaerocolumna xylanovorans DSM 12503 TaxID=1121345 RepID=A0A1M7XWE8_9FIRM|nr:sugar phosphate isomerase/epimerase family protein [Anaerocolumna xylanovorans]SHO43060.1 Sugar phosphate isomerase/epimerase [Anaerocolumna xylanovorans DSM 12503]